VSSVYFSMKNCVEDASFGRGGGHYYNNNFKLTGKTNYCHVWSSVPGDIHEHAPFVSIHILVVFYQTLPHT
jgi:hypothetical protein